MNGKAGRTTCPTCGGKLKLNPNTKMYDCPFCGVSSDYKYLSADTAVFRAKESLNKDEYHSALKAYEFLFSVDPHNFEAYRGMILIAARVRDISQLIYSDVVNSFRYPEIEYALQRAKTGCAEEDKAYFALLGRIFEKRRHLPITENEISCLKNSMKRHEMDLLSGKQEANPNSSRPGYIDMLEKTIASYKVAIRKKEEDLEAQKKKLQIDCEVLLEMEPEASPKAKEVPGALPAYVPASREKNLKSHSCPTCGGSLKVHIDRQEYECPYCGDVFDYEYVFEDDVIDKAKEYWKDDELATAKKAYDFMLEKEPNNFRALRGKILIAANMRTTGDLDNYANAKYFRFPSGLVCVRTAKKACKKEHREYFDTMEMLFEKQIEHQKILGQLYRLRNPVVSDYVRKEMEEEEKAKAAGEGPDTSRTLDGADYFIVLLFVAVMSFILLPKWVSWSLVGILGLFIIHWIVEGIRNAIANHKYEQQYKADPQAELQAKLRENSIKIDELCRKLRELDPHPEDPGLEMSGR